MKFSIEIADSSIIISSCNYKVYEQKELVMDWIKKGQLENAQEPFLILFDKNMNFLFLHDYVSFQ